ncbi:hypothetical protein ROJ8625_02242 [Roseivivax jejudonensis]|uniref:Putative Flp pilus-assembly TadG-like N-terminal domain-containing protein n=1 Tax=Roseivivax jejudonensis TaxID=1529041 RepID=A0A1X6ZAV9_9RHOB|nr:pilus assembly protein TadG-related protein [Roseivivax jejudonensis]SLN46359.1 hypothetical protein ROJ8625_02242 [Roseivivax jejudonensis]
MTAPRFILRFAQREEGGVLVLWGCALAALLGFAALVLDAGRLATTQSELQSYADSVSLAAAAELDGRDDAIARARAAASDLLTDSQTFGEGGTRLDADSISLTFYRDAPGGRFLRDLAFVTSDPHRARFVEAAVAERTVSLPFSAALASISTDTGIDDTVAASAVAQFTLEACNTAPVAMCLPELDFSAGTSIGASLSLDVAASATLPYPGDIVPLSVLDPVDSLLQGTSICAGLLGAALEACLIGVDAPGTACTGGGSGLQLSAALDGADVLDAVNARLGIFDGVTSGLSGLLGSLAAPNPLGGVLAAGGLCEAAPTPQSLPRDDCHVTGTCGSVGTGDWSEGRAAYVEARYDGSDPFPDARTRLDFYRAEIAAAAEMSDDTGGGLVGGLLGGIGDTVGNVVGQVCTPDAGGAPDRRLMVMGGIDCGAIGPDGALPPVRQYFEVFVLGPGENGRLDVEITACLGGGCGSGTLDTEVRDVVRLVE